MNVPKLIAFVVGCVILMAILTSMFHNLVGWWGTFVAFFVVASLCWHLLQGLRDE